MKAVLEAGHEVQVLTLKGAQDDRSIRQLAPCSRIDGHLFRADDSPVRDLIAEADKVVTPHIDTARLIRRTIASGEKPWAVDFQNVLSRQYTSRWQVAQRVKWRVRERAILTSCNAAFTVSREEADALRSVCADGRILVATNGVDPSEWPESRRSSDGCPRFAFFGSLCHPPNADGLTWFLEHVWPRVLDQLPAELVVMGPGQPPPSVGRAANVVVKGRVDALGPDLVRACAVVVPIVWGIGARVKFVEALASGTAVVSTPLGAEGYDASGAYVAATSAEDFAAACVFLATHQDHAVALGRRGRAVALEKYTWARATAPIINWINDDLDFRQLPA